MIEADTPTMPARRMEQARRLTLPLAALAVTLALPACQDASAGDTGPSEPSNSVIAPLVAAPVPFEPLVLSRQTARMGSVAVRVGRTMAGCDRATAALHGSRDAAARAAELCGDESGALDSIKAPVRYDEAIAECANAYGAQVGALRQIAQGRDGGDAAADMQRQQAFCLADLDKAEKSVVRQF